jgi:hypothetical protein
MSTPKRSEIEKRIQKLSLEADADLLAQSQKKLEQKLDTKKLDDMLFEWNNLYQYYAERNYSSKGDKKDLDISIFMIKNYLYWTEYCQTYMGVYARKGQMMEAEAFDEAFNTLEDTMKEIMKTVRDFDEYEG